jgi:hypothetical protein
MREWIVRNVRFPRQGKMLEKFREWKQRDELTKDTRRDTFQVRVHKAGSKPSLIYAENRW